MSCLKNPKDLGKSIDALQSEITASRKKLEAVEAAQVNVLVRNLALKSIPVNGHAFLGEIIGVPSADGLKKAAVDIRAAIGDAVVILCAVIGGKASVAIALSDESVAHGLDAAKLIKEVVAPLIKGGGGGSKLLATAGGQDAGSFEQVITKVKGMI